jgi:hypothetical protein
MNPLKNLVLFLAALLATGMTVSCQKAVIEDSDIEGTDDDGKVAITLNVTGVEPFASEPRQAPSRATEIKDLCSRINVVIYQNGKRLTQVNQTSKDDGFGSVSLRLAQGSYALLVLAHSGTGNPALTNPAKVPFSKVKMTDTFYLYDNLTVSNNTTLNATLHRAVGMFRLKMTDKMPTNVEEMQFYYTGGSSYFDATTGYGCAGTGHGEAFTVSKDQLGQSQTFEFYTFPHASDEAPKMQVKALDSLEIVKQRVFTNVQIVKNQITQYTGSFFVNSDSGDDSGGEVFSDSSTVSIPLVTNDEWTTVDHRF